MVKKADRVWFVYLLECVNGRLYTGITTDLSARFDKHCRGKGAMFTRLNKPARMIAATACKDRSEASKIEWTVKQMTAAKKLAFVAQWPRTKDLPKK